MKTKTSHINRAKRGTCPRNAKQYAMSKLPQIWEGLKNFSHQLGRSFCLLLLMLFMACESVNAEEDTHFEILPTHQHSYEILMKNEPIPEGYEKKQHISGEYIIVQKRNSLPQEMLISYLDIEGISFQFPSNSDSPIFQAMGSKSKKNMMMTYHIRFTSQGAIKMKKLTNHLINNTDKGAGMPLPCLAIIVDGKVIQSPQLHNAISDSYAAGLTSSTVKYFIPLIEKLSTLYN